MNDNPSWSARNDKQSEPAVIGSDSLSNQYHILPPNTHSLDSHIYLQSILLFATMSSDGKEAVPSGECGIILA